MTATIIALAIASSLSTLVIRSSISRHPFLIRRARAQILVSSCISIIVWIISAWVVHSASAPATAAWQGFTWGTLIFTSLFLFYYFKADMVEHIHVTRPDSKSDTEERIYQGGSLNFGNVQVQGERQNPYNQIINRLRASLDTIIASPWMSITFGASIVLRIAGFTAGSIWYDEMFSLQVTRQGLVEMVQSLTLNISPPGFEILLWFVTRIFGWNVFSLRLISVLASILMLWAVYKITSVLQFSQRQKIVTLAAIGMLPYQLITAQQGRVYALFALLYLIGLYASIRSKWALLGISIAGMLWCHNISFLFIPGLLLISILECPKGFKQITSAATIAFVTFIPWAELSFRQAKMSIPWFAPLTPSTLAYNVYVSFFGWNFPSTFTIFAALWVVALSSIALADILIYSISMTLSSMRTFSAHREMHKNADLQPQKYTLSSKTSPVFRTKVLLLLAFLQPLGLMILAAILHKNVILYRTIFLLIPPFIMWMVYTLVPASPNIMHKVIWGVSAVIIIAGLATWTPKQQGGNLDEFAQFVEKHFQSGDAFYHNNGLSAIVFNYYFPDKPNYLMSAQGLLGEADLHATKIEPMRYEPSRVPAERVWVVWAHHVDLERINREADRKTSSMVTNCPLVSVLHYPQSWDNEIYLCEMKKP